MLKWLRNFHYLLAFRISLIPEGRSVCCRNAQSFLWLRDVLGVVRVLQVLIRIEDVVAEIHI